MLRLTVKILALCFVLCMFTTCKKENLCDCVKGTGKNTTETRTLSPFDKIIAQDKVDVHINQGSEYSVKVEGGKHVIKLLKTKTDNNTLTISDDNRCDFMRSYKKKITVYITVPSLKHIKQDGVGNIYMDSRFVCDTFRYAVANSGDMHLNLDADVVYGGMHGDGDVYMEGVFGENTIFAVGQGYFHGFNAIADKVILTLKTSGQMEVNVNSFFKIDMDVRSTGDILYTGHPTEVIKNIFGKGKLIDRN